MTRLFLPATVVRFRDPLTRAETTGTIVRHRCGPIDTYDVEVSGGKIISVIVSAVRAA